MPISDQNDATIPLSNIINLDELHRTLNKLGLQSRLVDKPVKYTNSFYQGWEWTPVPRGNLIDRLLELRREPGEQ